MQSSAWKIFSLGSLWHIRQEITYRAYRISSLGKLWWSSRLLWVSSLFSHDSKASVNTKCYELKIVSYFCLQYVSTQDFAFNRIKGQLIFDADSFLYLSKQNFSQCGPDLGYLRFSHSRNAFLFIIYYTSLFFSFKKFLNRVCIYSLYSK